MGEVYRAKDTKLGREVAIKLLLEEVAEDAERLARFDREARVLASLNHPNIATLHGFERDGDKQFLVMELVEGETLADRIKRGAIPLDEALPLFLQIAQGLEAAHEKGVIHRDLKPANIKVTDDGQVKILDFGLAKAMAVDVGESGDASMSMSPTLTLAATQRGEILGTAAYMSPEQARGKPLDKRTDVWAFGVCLFEALTGGRVFTGSDATEVIAAVIRDRPDFDTLPPNTPAAIRRLLRRCLEKDPRRRLRDIGDAGVEIDEAIAGDPDDQTTGDVDGPRVPSPFWRRALPVAGAAAVGAVLAIIGLGGWRTAPPVERPIQRLRMDGPAGLFMGLAISRDGSELVYTGTAVSGLQRRSLSDFETTLVAGTEGLFASYPAFSPDGRSIAFSPGDGNVATIPLNGGVAVTVAEIEESVTGLSWPDESLLVAVGSRGIFRIPATGGAAEQLVTLNAGEFAALPQLLPGGRAVLYTLAKGSPTVDWREAQVVVQSLDSGERSEIVRGSDGRYLDTGHLLYAVEGVWFASTFDLEHRRVLGSPVAMLPGVGRLRIRGLVQPGAAVVLSQDGTLVYSSGPASISNEREIAVVDRLGESEVLAIPARPYESPRVSPDGRRLAVSSDDGRDAAVWVYDMSRETTLRRLTFSSRSRYPVWSPDSLRLAYQSDEGGEPSIWVRPADGGQEAERWTTAESEAAHIPESWSSDGRYLSYSLVTDNGVELWLYSIEEGRAEPFGDVREPFPLNSVFSPDSRWIAYTVRTGGASVFVQPVPATGVRYQINEGAIGHHPFWNPRGGEIFYFGRGGSELVSAPITLTPSFSVGRAEMVPGDHPSGTSVLAPLHYDVLGDGQSFVRTQAVGGVGATAGIDVSGTGLRVVLNWFEELKRLVPTD